MSLDIEMRDPENERFRQWRVQSDVHKFKNPGIELLGRVGKRSQGNGRQASKVAQVMMAALTKEGMHKEEGSGPFPGGRGPSWRAMNSEDSRVQDLSQA